MPPAAEEETKEGYQNIYNTGYDYALYFIGELIKRVDQTWLIREHYTYDDVVMARSKLLEFLANSMNMEDLSRQLNQAETSMNNLGFIVGTYRETEDPDQLALSLVFKDAPPLDGASGSDTGSSYEMMNNYTSPLKLFKTVAGCQISGCRRLRLFCNEINLKAIDETTISIMINANDEEFTCDNLRQACDSDISTELKKHGYFKLLVDAKIKGLCVLNSDNRSALENIKGILDRLIKVADINTIRQYGNKLDEDNTKRLIAEQVGLLEQDQTSKSIRGYGLIQQIHQDLVERDKVNIQQACLRLTGAANLSLLSITDKLDKKLKALCKLVNKANDYLKAESNLDRSQSDREGDVRIISKLLDSSNRYRDDEEMVQTYLKTTTAMSSLIASAQEELLSIVSQELTDNVDELPGICDQTDKAALVRSLAYNFHSVNILKSNIIDETVKNQLLSKVCERYQDLCALSLLQLGS